MSSTCVKNGGYNRKQGLIWNPDRTRPRGRPKQRWSDPVRENLKLLGIKYGERLALNREAWRGIVKAAIGLNGLE